MEAMIAADGEPIESIASIAMEMDWRLETIFC